MAILKKMKIFNVRLGHANNSSSSHSLIFLDELITDVSPEWGETAFGGDNFVLTTRDSKMGYLAQIIYDNLRLRLGSNAASKIAGAWTGKPSGSIEDGYIDHQSKLGLPMNWDGQGLNIEFLKEFSAYLLQDKLVILGGSDEEGHPLRGKGTPAIPFPRDEISGYVARKDKKSNYWTLFNRENGTKLRFSFDSLAVAPARASAPELVDVKLTDYCSFGCVFCYQDSTLQGNHASLQNIKNVARALGELNVFEAALGGGEPTLHPDFIEILDAFRQEGVTPNFTTRSLAWLKKEEQKEAILSRAGSFAFSVMSAKEIKKLYEATKDISPYDTKVTAQLVMGVVDREEFKKILNEASKYRMSLTLLGYKHIGRGPDFEPHNYTDWLEDVIKMKGKLPQICIDTKLAADWTPALKKARVSPWLYHTSEGGFSGYIDAVKGTLAPSSYGARNSHKSLDLSNVETLSQEIEAKYAQLEIQEELKEPQTVL